MTTPGSMRDYASKNMVGSNRGRYPKLSSRLHTHPYSCEDTPAYHVYNTHTPKKMDRKTVNR